MMPTKYGDVYKVADTGSYVMVRGDQYKRIPAWLLEAMNGNETVTYWFGPYTFIDGFEATPEAKYLMEQLKYVRHTERAAAKIQEIRGMYSYWVRVDEEFMHILETRK